MSYFGVGNIAVYYKCKKRSAKIYRLARNRGKTRDTPRCNAVSACTGDRNDVYMEEGIFTQDGEDSVVLTGMK